MTIAHAVEYNPTHTASQKGNRETL